MNNFYSLRPIFGILSAFKFLKLCTSDGFRYISIKIEKISLQFRYGFRSYYNYFYMERKRFRFSAAVGIFLCFLPKKFFDTQFLKNTFKSFFAKALAFFGGIRYS